MLKFEGPAPPKGRNMVCRRIQFGWVGDPVAREKKKHLQQNIRPPGNYRSGRPNNNNNNKDDNVCHFDSSPGSYDEYGKMEWCQAAADPQPRPNDLDCESACKLAIGCQRPHNLSPFIIFWVTLDSAYHIVTCKFPITSLQCHDVLDTTSDHQS